jgi:hypothetical protein
MKISNRRNVIRISTLAAGYMLALSHPAFAGGPADSGGTKKFLLESCNSAEQRGPACMGEAPQPVEAPPPVEPAPNTVNTSGTKRHTPAQSGGLQ